MRKQKYLSTEAAGYLMEAAACKLIIKELDRAAGKFQRRVEKEHADREAEFERVMQYKSEDEIQDDFGWDLITKSQYETFLDMFRSGRQALEAQPPSVAELALRIIQRIKRDIDADRRSWEFSALTPEQQRAEEARAVQSRKLWKEKLAELKRRRGIIGDIPTHDFDKEEPI